MTISMPSLKKFFQDYPGLALIYAICVVVFGFIYWKWFPEDFNDSNARLEQRWPQSEALAKATILPALLRGVGEKSSARSPFSVSDLVESKAADAARISVSHMVPLEGLVIYSCKVDPQFHLHLGFYFKIGPGVKKGFADRDEAIEALQIHVVATLIPKDNSRAALLAKKRQPQVSFPEQAALVLEPDGREIIAGREGFINSLAPYDLNGKSMLLLEDSEAATLAKIVGEYAGQSERIGADLARMIYFSAVVITTLGLGDIAPLTDGARFFVGLEAFLGILLAGLIVNAIVVRASAKQLSNADIETAVRKVLDERLPIEKPPKTPGQVPPPV